MLTFFKISLREGLALSTPTQLCIRLTVIPKPILHTPPSWIESVRPLPQSVIIFDCCFDYLNTTELFENHFHTTFFLCMLPKSTTLNLTNGFTIHPEGQKHFSNLYLAGTLQTGSLQKLPSSRFRRGPTTINRYN